MSINFSNTDIITDFRPHHEKVYGEQVLHLNHRLAETGLFTEDALAELIDRHPASNYSINTMGTDKNVLEWWYGEKGKATGRQVIDAMKRGRMWMNIRNVGDLEPAYRDVLDSMFSEWERRIPGLDITKVDMKILISSPKAQVYYHIDTQGQMLWQIQGTKRVYVYPTTHAFLQPEQIQDIIMRRQEEEIEYEPWFDEYAQIIDLEPGKMLHWPLYGPHRVENHDMLNISIATEHWTTPIRDQFVTHYGNGVLRRTLGLKNAGTSPHGANLFFKGNLARAWKAAGLQPKGDLVKKMKFSVDPDAADGMKIYD